MFIVSQIAAKQENEDLKKAFAELDHDGDGQLTREELVQGYTKIYGDEKRAIVEVEAFLEIVDANKNGKLDFIGKSDI